MPEGDTIHRTAASLRRALIGRELRRVEVARVAGPLPATGARVERIEARGKHLLVASSDGLTIHTHQRMTGSWHLYRPGERWQRSPRAARVVLGTRGIVAVCFSAPVVEVLDGRGVSRHPALRRLGPDLCDAGADLDEAVTRARTHRDPSDALGEVLLDQRVASGIGNIYRCEALFVHGRHPATALGAVTDEQLRALLETAGALLRANLDTNVRTTVTDAPAGALWVYGRAGEPCRRCATVVLRDRLGAQARTVMWCPRCQPPRK